MPAIVVVVAAYAGSAAAGAVVIGGTLGFVASIAAGVIAGALAGALAGGIVAAVSGEDIGDGMRMGLKTGALAGGMAGAFTGWGAMSNTSGASGASGTSGTMGMGSDAASLAAADGGTGLSAAGEAGAMGMGSDAASLANAENSLVVNDATALTTGQVSGAEAVQVTGSQAINNGVANAGDMIGKTGSFIKNSAATLKSGLMSEQGVAGLVQVGGSMLQGAGEAEAAELQAEADQEAADTLYERNKLKLQDGVSVDQVTHKVNSTPWDKKTQTANQGTVGIGQGATVALNPQQGAAPVPEQQLASQQVKPYTPHSATLSQGLLNA